MIDFETIEDVYRAFETVGCCSFATLDGKGGVDSRIAHFFACDEEGLYLRTMSVKPFYRQMIESGKITACGEHTVAPCEWDEDYMPHFQPGFMVRVSGDVRLLTQAEVEAKAAVNPQFNVAIYDIKKYPKTCVFVLNSFRAELYDYDFNMITRDHKILRKRLVFGGASVDPVGLHIDPDLCIACGSCADACTHKAIVEGAEGAEGDEGVEGVEGNAYSIRGERCDECGNCYNACPVGAVISKGGSIQPE